MSDSILQIRPVERTTAKLVIGLAGTSGSGKTYSALMLAYGLAGRDASKVGLLDTENRRGSLYSHVLGAPFMIGDLTAPFSPDRYRQALGEFAESGVEVIVVDSMSHEWEGEGGCDEIARRPKANGQERKIADWITAKREHHRFMRNLLAMPCHVIACFRAREKADFKNPEKPVSLGIQPICEKNCMFEMTASYLLDDAGNHHREMKSTPEFFSFLVGSNARIYGSHGSHAGLKEWDGYLTTEHGEQMRAWCGGLDPLERTRNLLRLAAGKGMAELGAAWAAIDKGARLKLAEFKETLKDLAKHADDERTAIKGDNGAPDEEEEKEW